MAAGHLPLVPLADAAADAGHDVAFLTRADMAGYLYDVSELFRRVFVSLPLAC